MDDFDGFGFETGPAEQPAPAPAQPPRAAAPPPQAVPFAPQRPAAPGLAIPDRARSRAGIGAIAAACGAAAGGVLGGPLGIGAGIAAVGAARNLYRGSQGVASTDPSQQGESVRCLALGVVGLGIAGYLAYRIYSNDKDDDE